MKPLITCGTDGEARVISQDDHHGKRRTIAHVYGPDQELLTQMFIAAPELLAALKDLEYAIRTEEDDNPGPIIQAEKNARAAIAKAEGREGK